MNVKPKFVYYDIRRMNPVNLISYTHENDVDTQVLEVSMLDNGEPIELSADYTYTAAIVNRETKALINDSISCEINDSGNVLIPIDNFHTLGAQDLLIELTITDSAGDQVLVTPFPLWIHVNASILDDAQVTPESQGTVPELLEDAEKALEDAQQAIEDAGDYENLGHKPQINGHELSGNKTAAELQLQDEIKYTLPPLSTQGLKTGDLFISNQKLYRWQGADESFMRIGRKIRFSDYNPPEFNETTSVSPYDTGDLFVKKSPYQAENSQGRLSEADVYLCTDVQYWPIHGRMHYIYTWQKINIKKLGVTITSATVNHNGTIMFTMSDGSTVTTTGESVIGPQGPAGADGNDYVLTAQDKSDIAAIVLSELPTTQGVQYGNTSN